MSTEIVNIDKQLADMVADISNRIAKPSGDRIKVTQSKQFRFPDGTTNPGPFQAIILDFVASNLFYEGAFNKDEIAPPDCFALGANPSELVPSESSPKKQAQSCSSCPQNQFGSAGRGKACKNGRLIAVLPADFEADTPIWLLSVSPTGIKAFDAYVASIAGQFQAPPVKVVTTIAFDPKVDYPSLRFGAPEINERVVEAVARMPEARKRLLTEPDYAAAFQAKADAGLGGGQPMTMPARGGRSAARVVR
jgi:hypothetical protein